MSTFKEIEIEIEDEVIDEDEVDDTYEIDEDTIDMLKDDSNETYEYDDSSYNKANVDIMRSYLTEIGKFPILSVEEEIDLAAKAHNGDKDAYNKLYECNLKLVVSIAKKYKIEGIAPLDLIQEGNIGLGKAINMFDESKGYKLSTYATWWIKQSITRYIMNNSRSIRLPVHTFEKIHKIKEAKAKLSQELDREPTVQEIANETGLDAKKIDELMIISFDIVSLESPVKSNDGSEDTQLGDLLANNNIDSPEDIFCKNELNTEIIKILNNIDSEGKRKFSEREVFVISRRFGINIGKQYTYNELSDILFIPDTDIKEMESKAFEKINNIDSKYFNNIKRKEEILDIFLHYYSYQKKDYDEVLIKEILNLLNNATIKGKKAFSETEIFLVNNRLNIENISDSTLEYVGKVLNITRERVRQIESKAIKKLRNPRYRSVLRNYIYI